MLLEYFILNLVHNICMIFDFICSKQLTLFQTLRRLTGFGLNDETGTCIECPVYSKTHPFTCCSGLNQKIQVFCLCLCQHLYFFFGRNTLICPTNCKGMEFGVWGGNFWPSCFAEAIKTIKFFYEDLHIFIKEPYWKTKFSQVLDRGLV